MNQRVWLHILALVVALWSVDLRTAGSTISLNPNIRHQTFLGWETAVLSTIRDYQRVLPGFDALLDQLSNDLGVTRVLIAVTSGTEHPPGPGEAYIRDDISEQKWLREFAYDVINDNRNPRVADLEKFDLAVLDWQMENIVLPFKRKVEANGDKLYSYLSYGDKGDYSKFKHYQKPAEYAELMLVLFDHLKSRYGFIPDGINVINEPDSTPWTGEDIGRAVAATGSRLASAGYHPDFMVGAVADRGHAVDFIDGVMSVRQARPFVKELSYHCYGDAIPETLRRIAQAARAYGIRTVMNECWSEANTYKMLHDDLKIGMNSGWQQGVFNGANTYYHFERTEGTLRPVLNRKTRIMRQYYKYIRPGAQRIEATASDAAFDPLAFINGDGGYVTVLKAAAGGSCTIVGLPAGTYGVSYSTDAEFDIHLPDAVVAESGELVAQIPRAGVITVYRR